jgi:hypothetical protein
MRTAVFGNYKWTFACALAVALLCLYPQFLMWGVRGHEWKGAYTQVNGDEWLYSAYIQALIDGRPRRNDPYTGRDDRPQTPQPESVFSIQFIPAYLIAVPARLLGISASTSFIALNFITPFLLCLSLAWLINLVSGAPKFSASGAVFVICFGGFAAGVGLVSLWANTGQYYFLPFMRRYEPSAMIPVFFLFCGFNWRSLRTQGSPSFVWAITAGLTLAVLIFSYLYLWTTAVAWLVSLALLWLLVYRQNLKAFVISFSTIMAVCALALIPYALLLGHRSATLATDQKLTASHAPEFLRVPELISIFSVLVLVLFGIRKRMKWKQPEMVMALSFLLAPLLVFNQQIVTGKSLQPFHFEMFITNYLVLVGVVLGAFLIYQAGGLKNLTINRVAVWIVMISLWWAAIELVIHTKVIVNESKVIDSAAGVCHRLREKSQNESSGLPPNNNPRPLVLTTDYQVSTILPTFAPQAVLWSPNFDFINIGPEERRDRLYKFLYLSDFDGNKFGAALRQPMSTLAAVTFGHERVLPDLAVNTKPISEDEIAGKVSDYEQFCQTFTRETASSHPLSYVVAPVSGANLTNLDRWYERDEGERIDGWLLYTVKLR